MDVLLTLQFAGVAMILRPYSTNGQGITECVYDSASCSCETNKGRIELNKASTGVPYNVNNTITTELYFWEPCTDFTLYSVTVGSMQYVLSTYTAYSLGIHSAAFSDAKDGYARFNMNGGDLGRNTVVKCVCGSGNHVVFEGEDPKLSYNFSFFSNVCCLEEESGISAGTIIVIAFFSLLVVYFLFGTIFQVAVRKAPGREKIPNFAFWSALPGLVKDGVMFTFTCGRKAGYGKA